ncbi:hypothetical protein ACN47E_000680 [Coniothyrium glycines]
MTEPASKGKKSDEYKPSPLQHQIKPSSTDDDAGFRGVDAQIPDSDFQVPETQYEDTESVCHHESFHQESRDNSLPHRMGSVDRSQCNVHKMNKEVASGMPMFGQPLTKPVDAGSASMSREPFRFLPPPKVSRKTSYQFNPAAIRQEDTNLSTSVSSGSAFQVQHLDAFPDVATSNVTRPSNDVTDLNASYGIKAGAQINFSAVENVQKTRIGNDSRADRPRALPIVCPGSQPDLMTTHAVKKKLGKSKNEKLGSVPNNIRTKHCPRSMYSTAVPGPFHAPRQAGEENIPRPGRDSPIIIRHSGSDSSITECPQPLEVQRATVQDQLNPGRYGCMGGHKGLEKYDLNDYAHAPDEAFDFRGAPVKRSTQVTSRPKKGSSVVAAEKSPKEPTPANAVGVLGEGPLTRIENQEPENQLCQAMGSDSSKMRQTGTGDVPDRTVEQSSELAHHRAHEPRTQQAINDGMLHKISDTGPAGRVKKPQKKVRPQDQLSQRVLASPAPTTIEQYLEGLRVALLAERFRKEHEHNMNSKQQEQIVAALQENIKLQSDTIVDLKAKNHDLQTNLSRIREKAITNQKYIYGLQHDYDGMQKASLLVTQECKRVLQDKVDELEQEKSALRAEVEKTLEVLAKNQRTARSTVEDMYARLNLSEARRQDLMASLRTMTGLYEKERDRGDELDKRVVALLQGLQQQASGIAIDLTAKLVALEVLSNQANVDPQQGVKVQECLSLLRAMVIQPPLTVKDVDKAEKMLRHIHERIDKTSTTIPSAAMIKTDVTKDLETYIKVQLKSLRHDLLKQDETVTEIRTARETIKSLQQQVQSQNDHSKALQCQIKELERSEGNLKTNSIQLEKQLSSLRESTSMLLQGQQHAETQLQHDLQQARDDLLVANSETEKAVHESQRFQQESSDFKKSLETAKDTLRHLQTKVEQLEKRESSTTIHDNLIKNLKMEYTVKEAEFQSRLRHIGIERDEMRKSAQLLTDELGMKKLQIRTFEENVKALQSEIDTLHKEKSAVEVKLDSIQSSSVNRSEMKDLNDRMERNADELTRKTQDHIALSRRCVDLNSEITNVKESRDELQHVVEKLRIENGNLRQEVDSGVADAKQQVDSTKKQAQDQVNRLEEEKEDMLRQLGQARDSQDNLKRDYDTLLVERANLHTEVLKARGTNEVIKTERTRIEHDYREKLRDMTNKHRSELADSDERLTQTTAALKESEARNHRLKDEYQHKIQADVKLAEAKLAEVEQLYQKKLTEAVYQATQQQEISRSTVVRETPPRSLHDESSMLAVGRQRKKVVRQNQSVLIMGSQDPRSANVFEQHQGSVKDSVHREISNSDKNLFEEDINLDDFLEFDEPVGPPEPELIPETQEPDHLPQIHGEYSNILDSSSTDLTSITSDELIELEGNNQPQVTSIQRESQDNLSTRDPTIGKHEASAESYKLPITQEDRSFCNAPRPRSQANTASRMMPPPSLNISTHENRNPDQGLERNSRRGKSLGRRGRDDEDANGSPPGAANPVNLGSRHSLAQPGSSAQLEKSSRRKRRDSSSSMEQDTPSKRPRNLPASCTVAEPRDRRVALKSNTPRHSAVNPRSRQHVFLNSSSSVSTALKSLSKATKDLSHVGEPLSSAIERHSVRGQRTPSSYGQSIAATPRQSKRRAKGKVGRGDNAVYEDRFSQELGRR